MTLREVISAPKFMQALFEIEHTVQFSETDMAGLVHFSNFYKFMEKAELALLSSLEIPLIYKEGTLVTGWPRVQAHCSFLHPLRLGDTLRICIETLAVKDYSLDYQFGFYCRDAAVAKGNMKTVYASSDLAEDKLESRLIPEETLLKLQSFIN